MVAILRERTKSSRSTVLFDSDEAERIMREDAAMLRMAGGVPTFEELDEARKAAEK